MTHRALAAFGLISVSVAWWGVSAAQQPAGAEQFKSLARASLSPIEGEFRIPGLRADVQVLRDRWGVPHIYAQNVDDLFMAQGYVMAQDRLWQMEMWRRQREGRMAEILGPPAVGRDRQARLLKYRGPIDDREWTSYHPEGKRIFTAYAAGVNAFIAERKTNLPVEFKLTGIVPTPWTAETLLLRAGTFGDANRRAHARAQRRPTRRRSGEQTARAGSLGRPQGAGRSRPLDHRRVSHDDRWRRARRRWWWPGGWRRRSRRRRWRWPRRRLAAGAHRAVSKLARSRRRAGDR